MPRQHQKRELITRPVAEHTAEPVRIPTNREYLYGKLATHTPTMLQVLNGHPRGWWKRIALVLVIVVLIAAGVGALTRSVPLFVGGVVMAVALTMIPWWPVMLEEGPYYLITSPFANVSRATSGGVCRIAPYQSVYKYWHPSERFELSFADIEKLPIAAKAQVRLQGHGFFTYNPALLDLSGLKRDERKQRWSQEIRLSMDEIKERLRLTMREIIKTHLAGYTDVAFWQQALFHLKRVAVERLKQRTYELGITVIDLTIDVDIPAQMVAAWEADEAQKTISVTSTRDMTAAFQAANLPITPELFLRYMLMNKAHGIRLRLTDDINNLVGSMQPIGTGQLTTATVTSVNPVVSAADPITQIPMPTSMVPAPRPHPITRVLPALVTMLAKLGMGMVFVVRTTAKGTLYGLRAVTRIRVPRVVVSHLPLRGLPAPRPAQGQLMPGPEPKTGTSAGAWLDSTSPADPKVLEARNRPADGKSRSFYEFMDE